MRDHFKNFKLTRKQISYSNSFIFRSRCKLCGSLPCGRVFREPSDWTPDPDDFRAEYEGYVPPRGSINRQVASFKRIGKMNYSPGGKSTNVKKFRFELKKFDRQELWNRQISCECGRTWWVYKNAVDKKSTKIVTVKKTH